MAPISLTARRHPPTVKAWHVLLSFEGATDCAYVMPRARCYLPWTSTGSQRDPMESPCIKVCVIDPATKLCTGCKRSLAEIAQWSALTDAERQRIMTELPARKVPAAAVKS